MKVDQIPLDVALRSVALLPISERSRYLAVSRRFSTLSGPLLSRFRAEMGVKELRLIGAVGADPRCSRRGPAPRGAQQTARVALDLHPLAASAAKEMLQIKGPELAAVLDGVDRAAASLQIAGEPRAAAGGAEREGAGGPGERSILHSWDSAGAMSDAEAYAVLSGQLFVIGPPQLRHLRWMMLMPDAEEQFGSLQNARLYVADVDAKLLPAELSATGGCEALSKSCGLEAQHRPTITLHGEPLDEAKVQLDGAPRGVCGRLLFCAVEI